MPQRSFVFLLLVLAVNAVRDTSPVFNRQFNDLAKAGNSSMARLDEGANASVAGICDPNTLKREQQYCVEIAVPLPVFPLLKVYGGLRVAFDSNEFNCFNFKVAAALGVKIFFFSAQIELEYTMQQQATRSGVKCSERVPTSGVVFSYIFVRIAQYVKGDTNTPLSDNENKVDEQLEAVVDKWEEDSWDPFINDRKLRASFKEIYSLTKTSYLRLRESMGRPFHSIAEAVNLALKAHAEAQKYKSGWYTQDFQRTAQDVESCFDLNVDSLRHDKAWLWCYFSHMYTFDVESYRRLVSETCFDTYAAETHAPLWRNVNDQSIGIVVEANAAICAEADGAAASDSSDGCLVSFPREFLALYPCTSSLLMTYMVDADDDDFRNGEALEIVSETVDRQWGQVYRTEKGKKKKIDLQPYDVSDEMTLDKHAKTVYTWVRHKVFTKGVQDSLYDWYLFDPPVWKRYILAYGLFLKRLVQPIEEGERKGFAGALAPRFEFKDTLSIAFSLNSGNMGDSPNFCSAPYLQIKAMHVWNLNTWTNAQSCISGRAWIKPTALTTSTNAWFFRLDPTWCYDWQKEEGTFTFPLVIRHGTYSCAAAVLRALASDPESTVCISLESLSFRLVNQVMRNLVKELNDEGLPLISDDGVSTSNIKDKLKRVRDVIAAMITTASSIFLQNSALGLTHAAADAALGQLKELMPASITTECMHYCQQEVDLVDLFRTRSVADTLENAKTGVGYSNSITVSVGVFTGKAAASYEAKYTGTLP